MVLVYRSVSNLTISPALRQNAGMLIHHGTLAPTPTEHYVGLKLIGCSIITAIISLAFFSAIP